MAKQIKYGKVELSDESFNDENALIRVSMMLPLNLVRELKHLALNPTHGGKYQVLIRDVLTNYSEDQKPKRKKA